MFDFVDVSCVTDLGPLFAEAEARQDPDREFQVPVSLSAASVADAARFLVERGVAAVPWGRPSGDGGSGGAVVDTGGEADTDSGAGAGDGSGVAASDESGVGGGAGAGSDGVDVDVDVVDLMEAVETIGLARRFLAAAESVMVARLVAVDGPVEQRGERTASWLGRSQGVPGRQAAETTRVATALDSVFGKFGAALAAGEIDQGYCAALVRVSNERIEGALVDLQDELLDRIRGRRFGAWRRELSAICALIDVDGPEPIVERDDKLFLSETLDGLVDLRGTFTGSTAEELRQLVEAHTDRLFLRARRDTKLSPDLPMPTRAVLRARALVDLLRRGASGEGSGGPEIHINLDVEAAPVLADLDPDPGSVPDPDPDPDPVPDPEPAPGNPADQSALPVRPPPVGELSRDWFRRVLGQRGDVLAANARLADNNLWRLLCNPTIHTLVTNSTHEILQMGRAVRLATPAQRRALRVRDGGCVFPGCDAPIGWTQVHHAIHWSKGGRSDLATMCLNCTTHHDVTHQPDWQMLPNLNTAGNPTGTFRWITPSGEVLWSQRHGQFIP